MSEPFLRSSDDSDPDYIERVESWDSQTAQIISWVSDLGEPSVSKERRDQAQAELELRLEENFVKARLLNEFGTLLLERREMLEEHDKLVEAIEVAVEVLLANSSWKEAIERNPDFAHEMYLDQERFQRAARAIVCYGESMSHAESALAPIPHTKELEEVNAILDNLRRKLTGAMDEPCYGLIISFLRSIGA